MNNNIISPLDKLKLIFINRNLKSTCDFKDYINTLNEIEYICVNGHILKDLPKILLKSNKQCSVCTNINKQNLLDTELPQQNPLKKCCCCHELKGKSFFGKYTKNIDKLRNTCKLCRRKQHVSKTPLEARTLKYIKKDIFKFLCSRAKSNHNKKGFVETIDIDSAYLQTVFNIQNNKCFWSNCELDLENIGKLYTLSLDRLDCSKGYIKGNVVITSKFMNLGRGDTNIDDYNMFIDTHLKLEHTTSMRNIILEKITQIPQ